MRDSFELIPCRSKLLLKLTFIIWLISHTISSVTGQEEVRIIHAWQLRDFYTAKQEVEIDTMITSFQIHNPVFQHSISSSWLGNAGLASVSNYFPHRGMPSDFFFLDPFALYVSKPAETYYYNTRRPFSLIDFSTGGPRGTNEKLLNILHTQNVNPDFNVGFRYFNINSDGQYQNQAAVTNAISLFSSYELDNYQMHTNLNLNSVRVFENGGLVDDSSLFNVNYETQDHPVRLNDARNGVRNNSIFISQAWQPFLNPGSDTLTDTEIPWLQRFQVYHVLSVDFNRRTYEDSNPNSGFYPEVLINATRTFDSLTYRNFSNKLMVQLPEFRGRTVTFGAKGGLKNELIRGSYNVPPDTLYYFHSTESEPVHYFLAQPDGYTITDRRRHRYGSNALIASARGGLGDVFGIWAQGSYFFQGFKSGEYELRGGISFDLLEGKNRSIIEAVIEQKETTPSIFISSFSSNHFAWNNNFRKAGVSGLAGSLSMPERGFNASLSFNLLNNYLYFDQAARPAQYNDIFAVMSASVRKDFTLWRFHTRNIVYYQASGNQEILRLPEISLFNSTWFEQTLITGALNMQVGVDLYYSSGFYGYAYQPATSRFYLQNEKKIENYPYFDVFINFKHKRARFFFKAEHLNTGWLQPEYFSVLNHPRNERFFKFGISWSFYN
jgi:hypothetical protein